MTNTYFLVIISLVYGGIDGSSLDTTNQRLSIRRPPLEVAVAYNGSFVKAKSVTMYMESQMTKTFRISVICRLQRGEVCVVIDSLGEENNVVIMGGQANICFDCAKINTPSADEHNLTSSVNDSSTAKATRLKQQGIDVTSNTNHNIFAEKDINVTLQSDLIGLGEIEFRIANNSSDTLPLAAISYESCVKVEIKVIRTHAPLDLVFVVCVYFFEVIEMLAFGTQLDFQTMKKTFRRPVAPLIGFVCQYLGMPLIAYSIAKIATSDTLAAFGIFVAGICPGGGSSNIYAFLLDGDLSLSITMTTISTVMSLAMMPLWLYTLGQEFLENGKAEIPYTDILVTLSIILVPLAVGLLIKHRLPKVAELVTKILTGVITVLALVLIVTGIYANLYIFQLMTLKIVVIGCTLPYIGFILGGTISLLLGQRADTVKTIAIETGMQNTGIGFILLYNYFAEPYGEIASVAPLSSEIMSPIPPFVISIIYIIYQKCSRKYTPVKKRENEPEMVSDCSRELSSGEFGNNYDNLRQESKSARNGLATNRI